MILRTILFAPLAFSILWSCGDGDRASGQAASSAPISVPPVPASPDFPTLSAIAVSQAAPASDGPVIRGKVVFEGKPPKDKKIAVDADPYCTSQHSESLMTEVYKVGEDGSVQNVFVWIKKGLEGRTFPVPAKTVVLDQHGCQYVPHVLGIQVGQGLVIRNSDETMHNIHAVSKLNAEFNFSQAKKGTETTKTFNSPEIMVRVKCDVHGWMGAYIGVVSHPCFQVTGEKGAFELKNLPPGEYEVAAWHEKFGTLTETVKIGDKETKALTFTFKGK